MAESPTSVNEEIQTDEFPANKSLSPVFRYSLGICYLAAVTYMTYELSKALSLQSMSQGLQNILANPWATAALVDFLV
jgi:hypothetical protein